MTENEKYMSQLVDEIKQYPSQDISQRLQNIENITAERNNGMKLLNTIGFDQFTFIKAGDKLVEHWFDVEYDEFLYYKGTVYMHELDLDFIYKKYLQEKIIGIVIDGDLIVERGIINKEIDFGPGLLVKGDVIADYIITGGSEIDVKGTVYARSFVTNTYNHGKFYYKGIFAPIAISENDIFGEKGINYSFSNTSKAMIGQHYLINYFYDEPFYCEEEQVLFEEEYKDIDYLQAREDDSIDEKMDNLLYNFNFEVEAFADILKDQNENLRLLKKVLKKVASDTFLKKINE